MVALNEGPNNGIVTKSDNFADSDPSSTRQEPLVPSQKDIMKKRKKKRVRGQKAKSRVVLATGEEPRERNLRKGKVREFDILRKGDEQAIPWKTRQFMKRLARFQERTLGNNGCEFNEKEYKSAGTEGKKESVKMPTRTGDGMGQRLQNEAKVGYDTLEEGKKCEKDKCRKKAENGRDVATMEIALPREKKFNGMQPGESFAQFSARLRKESKQMVLEVAKKSNHQREKKRAYYEKRKEAAIRRKRRRHRNLENDDVEDVGGDEDEQETIAHLPSYWQEIIRNNGKPISAKQRKRMNRAAQDDMDVVAFGEQADRPPKLSVQPVRRGRLEKQ